MGNSRAVLIRADANHGIGSGHMMRCSAVAKEVARLGGTAHFVVSNGESADFARGMGLATRIEPGDIRVFCRDDGLRLASLADELDAQAILVDSYAVTNGFFAGLCAARRSGVRVVYIDDLFTFGDGYSSIPQQRAVDVVVNYSFSASAAVYRKVYGDACVVCLVGPFFAPIRGQFERRLGARSPRVENILITTGSTNKNRLLERLVDICLHAAPQAELSVVVGKMASYEGVLTANVSVLHNVSDMAALMGNADLALSAAGSTLYELAVVGVPTVAIAMTENQSLNAAGFEELDLGPVFRYEEGCFFGECGDLTSTVSRLSADRDARCSMSERASSIVDGRGAERLAQALLRQ